MKGYRRATHADVAGRRVVITGAAGGLGRVLATAFDSAGARLGLVGRSETALKEVAESLHDAPLLCVGDVRDEEFNESVATGMRERFDGLDAWICNAGVSPRVTTVAKTTPATWREILDVNLTGTFLGARAGAAVMEAGGRIIVTGSVLGKRPRAGLAAYSASKSGAHSLVEALAQELGPRGITVNAVALGWFDTGMGAHWRRDAERDSDIVAHTALRRWGTSTDLPGIYLFLASDSSSYLTGATITVDGGYSVM